MDLGLRDVHVLITGASGGIGLETTKLFLEQGARVTAHYNTNSSPLEPLLFAHSDRLCTAQADLTSEASTAALFNPPSKFGPVQVLVVNHAIFVEATAPLVRMELAQWERTLSANLTSSFLVIREYLRGLEKADEEAKAKANVILIGSTAGKFGEAGHADYAASKSAMMYGLTTSLKNEIVKIAPRARVNTVAPGWVATRMAADEKAIATALATTPLRKIATPRDVANQIVVLSSNEISGHVSGHVLMVEGGMEGRVLNPELLL